MRGLARIMTGGCRVAWVTFKRAIRDWSDMRKQAPMCLGLQIFTWGLRRGWVECCRTLGGARTHPMVHYLIMLSERVI